METEKQTPELGSIPLSTSGTIRISWPEKISFALGDAGCNMVWATLQAFMMFFYTDIAGISAAFIGTMYFVIRIMDAFSDIGMGILVDRTNTKWGKARPYILWLAVPMAIGMVLLFTAPDFSTSGKQAYAFATYFLVSVILYTALAQPYNTMMALITNDQYDRSILNILRMGGGVLIAMTTGYFTLPLVNAFGGGKHGWQMMAVVYAIICVIFLVICFAGTKEKIKPVKEQTVPVKVGLKALFANKYWIMMLLLGTLTFMMFSMPAAWPYYAQYVMGNPMYVGTIMTMNFLSNLVIFIFIMPWLLKKIGKRNSVFVGFVLYAIGVVIILTNPTNYTTVIIATLIRGAGFAPLVGTMYAFIADTIEYGEWKTGVRSEGLTYSAASFGQKCGTGLGGALIGWLLAAGGYVANAPVQSAASMGMINFMFIWLQLIAYVLAVIILLFYKLDKEYPAIIEELKQRKLNKVSEAGK
ncbi:MFS transporter [Dehalobacter sp. DCM]|uniref:MFS transporter n=1 Tax=Dehalobacter sp. DCM TaxID=2907827 RepID=UPI0030820D7C|nr:MFS transporter [Dehalobacter sp. DCM]